jgi:hypothetical protein
MSVWERDSDCMNMCMFVFVCVSFIGGPLHLEPFYTLAGSSLRKKQQMVAEIFHFYILWCLMMLSSIEAGLHLKHLRHSGLVPII